MESIRSCRFCIVFNTLKSFKLSSCGNGIDDDDDFFFFFATTDDCDEVVSSSLGRGDRDTVAPNELRLREFDRSLALSRCCAGGCPRFFRLRLLDVLRCRCPGDTLLEPARYGDGLREVAPNVLRITLACSIFCFLSLAHAVGSNRTDGDRDRDVYVDRLCCDVFLPATNRGADDER